MSEVRAISVRQLNFYVKNILEGDRNLRSVTVEGEISGFVLNSRSGHAYFTLKDELSQVKTVMFSSCVSALGFVPENGMKVLVHGKISLYERDGQFQLVADKMTRKGVGDCYTAFLRLKEKLEAEGFFSEEYKKPIPRYPKSVGLITSPTGAALQDFINVTKKRFPSVKLTVYPASVQGENTVGDVISGLDFFDGEPVDVVAIIRGGGNYEDLAVFNDERLARRVFAAKTPIVSAIGHEIDFTILDFVSDLRAPTPSAAAELIMPDRVSESETLYGVKKRLAYIVGGRIEKEKAILRLFSEKTDMSGRLRENARFLDGLCSKINAAAENAVRAEKIRLSGFADRINALNPLAVLSRGFAVAEKEGKPISSAESIYPGDKLRVKFKDGVVDCVAENIRRNDL